MNIRRIDISKGYGKTCECCGEDFKDGAEIIEYTYYSEYGNDYTNRYCSEGCLLYDLKNDEFGAYAEYKVELYNSYNEENMAKISRAKTAIDNMKDGDTIVIEDKFVVFCFIREGSYNYVLESKSKSWMQAFDKADSLKVAIERKMLYLFGGC